MNANRFSFRCWNPYAKKMETADSCTMPTLWSDGTLHIDYDCTDVTDALILMQSTGLCDRQGKEIFEGDILEDKQGNRGEVWFNDNAASMFIDPDHGLKMKIYNAKHECRIIGNIYENKELIETATEYQRFDDNADKQAEGAC